MVPEESKEESLESDLENGSWVDHLRLGSKRGQKIEEKSGETNGIEAIGDQYIPGMHLPGMPDSLQLPKNRSTTKRVSFIRPLALAWPIQKRSK